MKIHISQTERRSWTEINLAQLITNYRVYKETLPSHLEIMAVIKADAYGCGDSAVALALEAEGVKLFAVSNIDEAITLRNSGVKGEILILGYTSPTFSGVLSEKNIIQTLVSEEHAAAMAKTGKKIRAQFAIDTGMNRIGLDADHPEECEKIIRRYAEMFDLCGMFTHFCVADSFAPDNVSFTKGQIEKFKAVYNRIADLNLQYVHCCNSAGGMFYVNDVAGLLGKTDIVRLGIVLYGLKPDTSNQLPDRVRPVLTWKTVVSMVKNVNADEYIGYGRTYRAERERRIATLTTGYADGYDRHLSNKGHVLIHGKEAPIVGRVCMDQMTVDVTDIPDVKMGDVAVLIGSDGSETYTADNMAEDLGTIGYEVVCSISKRVQRFYV